MGNYKFIAFEKNPQPMWICSSAGGEVLEINEAALELFGFTQNDRNGLKRHHLGKPLESRIPAALLADWIPEARQCEIWKHRDTSGQSFYSIVHSKRLEHAGQPLQLMTVLRKARNEATLTARGDEDWKSHLEHSPLAHIEWDATLRVRSISPAVTEWFGFSPEELEGNAAVDLLNRLGHPDDIESVAGFFEAMKSGRNLQNEFDLTFRDKAGRMRYTRWHNSVLLDHNGRLSSVLSLVEDFTESREAEQEIQRRSRIIQMLHRTAAAVNKSDNVEEVLRRALNEFCTLAGWPIGHAYVWEGDQFEPTDLWYLEESQKYAPYVRVTERTVFPVDRGGYIARAAAEKKTVWDHRIDQNSGYKRREAAVRLGLQTIFCIPVIMGDEVKAVLEFYSPEAISATEESLEAGEALGLQLGRIWERLEADRRHERSEDRYRSLFENSADALLVIEGEVITDCNRKATELFQTDEESLIGTTPQYWSPTRQPDGELSAIKARRYLGRALEGYSLMFEWKHQLKDDRVIYTQVSLSRLLMIDKKPCVLASVRDITEEKQTELSRERLNAILEATPDFVGMADINGRIFYLNSAGKKLMGIGPDESIGETHIPDYLTIRDTKRVMKEALPYARRHSTWTGEVKLQARDGSRIPVSAVILAHRNGEGDVQYYSTICRDLREQKKNLQRIRESEEQLDLAMRGGDIGIWDYNLEDRSITFSGYWKRLLGYEQGGFPEGAEQWKNLIHPDDYERVNQSFVDFLKKDADLYDLEFRVKAKSGEWKWLLSKARITERDASGYPRRVTGVHIDVSNRKKAEMQLQEQFVFTDLVINSLPGLFYMVDEKGRLAMWNSNFETKLGYTAEELREVNALELYKKSDRELVASKVREAYQKGEAYTEASLRTKDGRLIPHFLTGKYFESKGKRYVLGAGVDISETKAAKARLRRSELYFRQLFENSPYGIAMLNPDLSIRMINKGFADIFGYAKDEVIGVNIDDLITPASLALAREEVVLKNTSDGDSFQFESIRVSKDGREIPVMIGGVPIFMDAHSEDPSALFVMYVDITERKQYEEELQETLEEKSVLLQEVHHRVKNNLAIISGLLQLQMFTSEAPEIQKALSESQMRVHTMALIHETLYKADRFSEIELTNYLQSLGDYVEDSMKPKGKEITVSFSSATDKPININQAIPCALLFNEILTNAFEHAFDERQEGCVDIQLDETDDLLTLQVSDNGSGLPDELLRGDRETLGLTLIHSLTEQLDGNLHIDASAKGTTFRLQFKRKNYKGAGSALIR